MVKDYRNYTRMSKRPTLRIQNWGLHWSHITLQNRPLKSSIETLESLSSDGVKVANEDKNHKSETEAGFQIQWNR